MNKIKLYLKVMIIPILSIIIIPLFFSIFNILGLELNKIVLIVISSILLLITGYLIGIHTVKKGFINGLIVGLCFVIFILLLSLIFKSPINTSSFIYYLILIISSILGSIIGINRKKEV